MIMTCTCKNAFQDAEYGKNQRVHNNMIKDGHLKGFRCTVCSHVVVSNTDTGKKGK